MSSATAMQGHLFSGWAEPDPEAVQYVSTTAVQLDPMLRKLHDMRLISGGHWVSPTAGHGEIPRLCAEILPDLGRPLPVQWTCYELANVPRPEDADTWARVVEWRPGQDFTRLPNLHTAQDVAMVMENFPWGRGAPSLRSLVEHCWRLYPYAHVVALYAFERAALDWERHGEQNAAWLAEHGPDVYALGRGRKLQIFGERMTRGVLKAEDEMQAICAWLHWRPDARNRNHMRFYYL